MVLEKEQVIKKIREAKETYGLTYTKLAREMGITPSTISMFINERANMSVEKQIRAICIIENYIESAREQLKILEYAGVCTNE